MRIYTKHLKNYLFTRMILFQMPRVAIFLLKHEVDLLSLMFSGKEFQMEVPSYIKLFFILFVLGFGKRIELEVPRRLWFEISPSKINNFLRELGPMLLSVLNIIFALAFFSLFFEWFPTKYTQYCLLIYFFWHMCYNTDSSIVKFL